MKRGTSRRRRKEWSLAQLSKARPSAVQVWQALCALADERGSPVVTPTRAVLAAMAGINVQTVSDALTSLEAAGWIDRAHVPRMNGGKRATLLRIVLRRRCRSHTPTNGAAKPHRKGTPTTSTADQSHPNQQTRTRNGSLTTPTAGNAVDVAERQEGRCSSTTSDFPSERGGAPAPPPPLRSGGDTAPPQNGQGLERGVGNDPAEHPWPFDERAVVPVNEDPDSALPQDPELLKKIDQLFAEDASTGVASDSAPIDSTPRDQAETS